MKNRLFLAMQDVGPRDEMNNEFRLNGAGFLRLPNWLRP